VCVLNVEDGVVVRLAGDGFQIEGERRIRWIAGERVASGIDSDFLDKILRVTMLPARLESLTSSPPRVIFTS